MITKKQVKDLNVRTFKKVDLGKGKSKRDLVPGTKLKFFSQKHGEVAGELIKLNHRTVILEVKNGDKLKQVKRTLRGVSL